MAAARARERALAGYRKNDEEDEEDEEDITFISDETTPMVDEDGNRVPYPKLLRTVRSDSFNYFIIFWVLVAGVLVGVQTDKSLQSNHGITSVEAFILLIFIVEAGMKIVAEMPRPSRYFQDPWNVMDFLIAAVGFIAFVLENLAGVDLSASGNVVLVFRLFRLLRIMKLVKAVPQLRIIVTTMINSLPSVSYISILIFLLLYVYGVLGCFIFGENDAKHFGNLGVSLITLFRVMTFDQWANVLYVQVYGCIQEYTAHDIERFGCTEHDSSKNPVVAVIFFFTFLLFVSFIVLNLFIGVVTTSLQSATREVKADPETATEEFEEITNQDIEKLVLQLREQLQDCRAEMEETRSKLAMILQGEQQ